MRIAFFTELFFPYISGVSSSIAFFAEALAEKKHQIMILAPQGKGKPYHPPLKNIKMQYISALDLDKLYPNSRAAKPQIPKNYREIKSFDPDIIHFHTPFVMGAEAITYAKLLKKPLVGTFHGYFMEPEYFRMFKLGRWQRGASFINRFLWKYNNLFYKQCDLVISPSEYSKKDLKKQGIKKPITVVHNPIDLKNIKKVDNKQLDRLKKRFWLGDNVILYVGRISMEKSLNILILALKKVLAKVPDAQLLLVGGGPIVQELRDLAIGLGIERSVVFTGEIEYKKLLSEGYYQTANLFATSSTSECQPMTLIEAMAFGLPIVAAKAKGNIEMVKGNGYLCKPGNVGDLAKAITTCLTNKGRLRKMSTRSNQLVKNYTVDKTALSLEKTYQSLLRSEKYD